LDAGIYKCDNKVPHAASLVSHFVNKSVPDRAHHAVMVSIYDPKEFMTPVLVPGITAKPYYQRANYSGEFSTLETYATDVPVVQGQSGSLLISTEAQSQNKIIGILVCRSTSSNTGYFKPISQESIKLALQELDVDENLEQTVEEDMERTCTMTVNPQNLHLEFSSLNYLGKIAPEKRVTQSTVTKFTPSLIQDKDSLTHLPAVLHPYDERLNKDLIGKPIIYRALQGFDDPVGAVNTRQLDIAVEELSLEYQNLPEPPSFND
jgi:hypothetical protein